MIKTCFNIYWQVSLIYNLDLSFISLQLSYWAFPIASKLLDYAVVAEYIA